MPEHNRLRTPVPSAIVVAAALVVVIAGLRAAEPMIVPFLLSVFVAVLCAPPLFWLESHGLPRWAALLVVVASLFVLGVAVVLPIGTSVDDFYRGLPAYRDRVSQLSAPVFAWLHGHGIHVTRQDVSTYVDPGAALDLVRRLFQGFGNVLANAFLILLTVVFILFEASSFRVKLHAMSTNAEASLDQFREFSRSLVRYIVIKTLMSVGTGVAVGLWLWAVGVDYAVLWGVLAFMLNFVPNIGSVIAAVPPVLLALVQLGPTAAAWSGLGFLIVNMVFGNVIEPRYLGRELGLSSLVVFLSLVFWGWVLGPVGMFLSVPLTMMAKIALAGRAETRWIAIMLGPAQEAAAAGQHGDRTGSAPPAPGAATAATEEDTRR
ncbi:MAG: AI-2E family transporter [Ectothiorhodospiraceae bacterium]|nr:AI-2E family transporter [Ectothiorhodospiraceae bacterium]